MPVITLSMYSGKTPDIKKALCIDIKSTIKKAFAITHDNFHFRINEYNKDNLYIPDTASDNYLSLEIQSIHTYSIPDKEQLYKQMSETLLKYNIKAEDLVIILSFPPAENWFIRGLTGIEINKPKN